MRRRDFLHVGFAGGIGLTLADFFRIKEAQADQKFYESKEGPAKSVIFIFMPDYRPILQIGVRRLHFLISGDLAGLQDSRGLRRRR